MTESGVFTPRIPCRGKNESVAKSESNGNCYVLYTRTVFCVKEKSLVPDKDILTCNFITPSSNFIRIFTSLFFFSRLLLVARLSVNKDNEISVLPPRSVRNLFSRAVIIIRVAIQSSGLIATILFFFFFFAASPLENHTGPYYIIRTTRADRVLNFKRSLENGRFRTPRSLRPARPQ